MKGGTFGTYEEENKPEVTPFLRSRCRLENNIKVDFKVTGWKDVDWKVWFSTGISSGIFELEDKLSGFIKYEKFLN